MNGHVLIMTSNDDVHADFVVAELHSKSVPVIRLDPATLLNREGEYSFQLGNSAREIVLTTPEGSYCSDSDKLRSVWIRRPTPTIRSDPDWDGATGRFFRAEAEVVRHALQRVLIGNRDCLWVNDPTANRAAANKPIQLELAQRVGLRVPATLITNSPARALEFYRRNSEDVVAKPLSATAPTESSRQPLYTTSLPRGMELDDFRDVEVGSGILQARVAKAADARVAVIGAEVLAAEILSQGDPSAITDWRAAHGSLPQRPIDVPTDVADQLQRLKFELGLASMHADFAIDSAGQWWFFEANPNGQWLWLELEAGLPISRELASLLSKGRLSRA